MGDGCNQGRFGGGGIGEMRNSSVLGLKTHLNFLSSRQQNPGFISLETSQNGKQLRSIEYGIFVAMGGSKFLTCGLLQPTNE
jgi:hypothetical protein